MSKIPEPLTLRMKVVEGPDGNKVARIPGWMERVKDGISGRVDAVKQELETVGEMGPEAYSQHLREKREARWIERGERSADAITGRLEQLRDTLQTAIDSGQAQKIAPKAWQDRMEQMKRKYYKNPVLELTATDVSGVAARGR